jgi:hypothetical protein
VQTYPSRYSELEVAILPPGDFTTIVKGNRNKEVGSQVIELASSKFFLL